MPGQVPRDVVQKRFDRLVELVQASALESNIPLVGTVQEVLVEGPSKRDERVLTGRTPTNKVVHVAVPEGHVASEYAGRFVRVLIEEAQTWFLSGAMEGTNP
jgi:tRNA-2-methylthio-N6-dimethylallyladenosine synthase